MRPHDDLGPLWQILPETQTSEKKAKAKFKVALMLDQKSTGT